MRRLKNGFRSTRRHLIPSLDSIRFLADRRRLYNFQREPSCLEQRTPGLIEAPRSHRRRVEGLIQAPRSILLFLKCVAEVEPKARKQTAA